MKYDTQTPYVASYIIVKDEKGRIAFVRRQNTAWLNGYYGLPAGKVEVQENYVAAAIREAKEEIGISVNRENLHHKLTVHRMSDQDTNDRMEWVDIFFEVELYSGEVHNAEPTMSSEIAWFDPADLPSKVTPPVPEALEAIRQGKTYIEHGW